MSIRHCAGCGQKLHPEVHYLFRAEFISAPDPELQLASPQETGQEIIRLLKEVEQSSAEDLSDDVYCQVEHRICSSCRSRMRHYLLLPCQLDTDLLQRLEAVVSSREDIS